MCVYIFNNTHSHTHTLTHTHTHQQTVKAFLPAMREKNQGHIVSIASVMAFQGVPKLCDYSASKAAALSFAETLRYELKREGKNGVAITAICPYHIQTQLFKGGAELGRVCTVEPLSLSMRTLLN